MELINDLGTELAFAFLVEKRHRQTLDSEQALALIGRIREVLETVPTDRSPVVNEHTDESARPFPTL